MIKIEVNKDGVTAECQIKMSGNKEDVMLEMCTLLDALESKKESRDLLHFAIDYRIKSLIKEFEELEDDGEL